MDTRKWYMDKVATNVDFDNDLFPYLPIVEISGDKRVLIENHCGVQGYESGKISVNSKLGSIIVCGEQLKIRKMTKEQLIISGRINCVSLVRRNCE